MKKIFFICLLTILFSRLMSQDNIILRNGEEIKAKITEVTITEVRYKKWDYQDGPIYSILKNEIFMIVYQNGTKDVFKETAATTNGVSKKEFKQKGFSNITEVHFALGSQLGNDNIFCVQTVNGYQFNSILNAGVGIGLDYYIYPGRVYYNPSGTSFQSMIPIFADLRFNLLKGSVKPFIIAAGGYSLIYSSTKDNYITYKGGLLLNPSVGVKIFVSSKIALNFSVGYRMQKYSYVINSQYNSKYNMYNSYYPSNILCTLNFINIKTGINF